VVNAFMFTEVRRILSDSESEADSIASYLSEKAPVRQGVWGRLTRVQYRVCR
jgi:hypothetical protein